MIQQFPLTICLIDQKMLDIGSYTVGDVPDREAVEYRITPPLIPLFDQVVEYLWSQPEPPYRGLHSRFLGVGFAALTMRWGSYLAALCAPEFPLYNPDITMIPDAQVHNVSRIADAEMKRLNIEISANIAALGKLYSEDKMRCYDLIDRAYEYLPMPLKSVRPNHELRHQLNYAVFTGSPSVYVVKHPEDAAEVLSSLGLDADDETSLKSRFLPLPGEPARVIGNLLAHYGWRNTVIENYHAGVHLNVDAPLLPGQRRFTKEDERAIMKVLSENSYEIFGSFFSLYDPENHSSDPRFRFVAPYPDTALALVNGGFLTNYPSNWSATEQNSEIILRHYAESERG